MRLTQRLETIEKRLGAVRDPQIWWVHIIHPGENGAADEVDRKAIAFWGKDNSHLFEADPGESKEDFEARVTEAAAAPGASTAYVRHVPGTA